MGLPHGALNVERLDVLPILLEQRDKKVHCDLNVGIDLLLCHVNVGACNTKGKHLLELELHCRLDVLDLLIEVLVPLHEGRELPHLVHGGSEKTRDLLHNRPRRKEEAVLVREFLDLLLILVEGLEGLDIQAVNTGTLGFFDVVGVAENTARHALPGHVRKLNGTGETLVFLGVVVLEDYLELDRLNEFALLLCSGGFDVVDRRSEGISRKFAHL